MTANHHIPEIARAERFLDGFYTLSPTKKPSLLVSPTSRDKEAFSVVEIADEVRTLLLASRLNEGALLRSVSNR